VVIVLLAVVVGLLITSGSLFSDQPRSDLERDYQLLIEGLKQNPDNSAVLMTLAEVEYDLGKKTEAMGHAEKAVEVDPNSPGIQRRYAQLLIREERIDEARIVLEALLKDSDVTNDAEVYFILAQIEREAGNLDTAIEHIDRAVRLQPVNGDMRIVYGGILEKAEKNDEAIEQYQEALRYLPNNEEAMAGLRRLGVEVEETTAPVMPGGVPAPGGGSAVPETE
jgi:tetratricopeptide (TPR) repeat protein